jgi:hypothetical protein
MPAGLLVFQHPVGLATCHGEQEFLLPAGK